MNHTGRIIIVACTQDRAADWCYRNGIPRRGHGTVVITRPERLRGDRARPDDRLVLLGGGFYERQAEELEYYLRICGHDLHEAEWYD